MSTMILHDKFETDWMSLGLGPLKDAIEPRITRERNGEYSLEFQYPVFSPRFEDIKNGNWIVADAGPSRNTESQRFEIQIITKPKNGIVTVYAEHYRYQLLRSIFEDIFEYEGTPDEVMRFLLNRSIPKLDFEVVPVPRTTASTIKMEEMGKFESVMDAFGGTQGSVLDLFGGEYIFDNNKISLPVKAGKETEVIIAYGKNLTDINQQEKIDGTYTSVFGWANYTPEGGEETLIKTPTIDSEYLPFYRTRRVLSVDFSNSGPTNEEELKALVEKYIVNNEIGIPKISIKASFANLVESAVSGDLKNLEEIDLCDYVTVAFNEMKIFATAQIIKTVWRPDLNKYESMELGEAKTNLGDVIKDKIESDTKDIRKKFDEMTGTYDFIKDAVDDMSNVINNPGIGNIVIYPSLADPQEILIMDTKDVETAKKIWRWNAAGLAYSRNGYGGPWEVGINSEGQIVADFITTGVLRAIEIIGVSIEGARITGGFISSKGQTFTTRIEDGLISWIENSTNKEYFQVRAGEFVESSGKTNKAVGFNLLENNNFFVGYKDKAGDDVFQNDRTNMKFYPSQVLFQASPKGTSFEGISPAYMSLNAYSHRHQFGTSSLLKKDYANLTLKPQNINLSTFSTAGGGKGALSMTDINTGLMFTPPSPDGSNSGQTNLLLRNKQVWMGGAGAETYISGSFKVSGTKNATVPTENYGRRLLNAYETPESYFADYGEGVTDETNKVRIKLDPIFIETINTSRYMVFITPSELCQFAVIEQGRDYFIVETSKSNVHFSWNLVAHRKGHENVRLDEDKGFDNTLENTFDYQYSFDEKQQSEVDAYRDKLEGK